ncbi:hypothetical protein PG984_008493 [Apiospora sp. TS-2023a]
MVRLFDALDLPRKWKAATGKEWIWLTSLLFHFLLDLSRYNLTAIYMVGALLRLPTFQGDLALDDLTKSDVHREYWRAHIALDFAIVRMGREARQVKGSHQCWTRWFRAPRRLLTEGEMGDAFSAYLSARPWEGMDFILVRDWRMAHAWKLREGPDGKSEQYTD